MSKTSRVRRMRAADMEAILRIERACFRKDAYDRNLFAAYARRCAEFFLVSKDPNGELRGYILGCRFRGEAELVSVAVDPAARREGTASALLESLLRRLKRNGIGRLRLMVRVTNWRALRFYRKYGFAKVRLVPGYYEDGRNGWQMEKHLR
jgi:ribosomal-protein-alanine N-acetyltransferase